MIVGKKTLMTTPTSLKILCKPGDDVSSYKLRQEGQQCVNSSNFINLEM